MDRSEFAKRLGHEFSHPRLLERALTHRSWCAEHAGDVSNERLEFLGDAILGAVVAEHVFSRFPELSEGWLSRARSSLVRSTTLAVLAEDLGLGEMLRLGKGEDASGGRAKPSLLADALEALIGAIYLDGGLEPTRRVILELLHDRIAALPSAEDLVRDPAVHDYKSRLQELVARHLGAVPTYHNDESGPEHEKEFAAVVEIDGVVRGRGVGRNKKTAEQAAAKQAFNQLLQEVIGSDAAAPIEPPSTSAPMHVDAASGR